MPSNAVDAVGATGAGFDGHFLARLAAGDDPTEAASHAATAASLPPAGHGAVAQSPRPDAVRWALSQGRRATAATPGPAAHSSTRCAIRVPSSTAADG
jgi:hypothetical protein